MHQGYEDIRSRISEEPSWFDEHGVPRYGEFSTKALANIYWREAVLAEIRCQACHEKFLVSMSFAPFLSRQTSSLEQDVRSGSLHYGDPPSGCCGAGASMNSEMVRVIQFWKRDVIEEKRVSELEGVFDV